MATTAHAQRPWQLAGRLQSGVEYDDNIYESPSQRVAATVGRVLVQTRAAHASQRWRLTLDYAGALLLYEGARVENKLLQDASAGVTWLSRSGVKVYLRAQGHLKLYLESPADYGTTSGAMGVLLPLINNAALDLGAETGQLDYAAGDDFDFTFNGAFAALRYQFSPRFAGEIGIAHRKLDYLRASFVNTPSLFATGAQHDEFNALRAAASYNGRVLLQGRFELQRNRSNREVFDYNRFRAHVLAGYPFAARWLLRASLLFQRKHYLAAGPPVSLPELDPEREQSNHLILDLSRDVSESLTLLLRWSRHNNESPVRSLFYRKTLVFAGLELRL
jgi:hypothetical protein